MTCIVLEALPPRTTRGTIVRLLVQLGGIDRRDVGLIDLRGRVANVEVPEAHAATLVKALDGASLANGHIRASLVRVHTPILETDHFGRLLRLLDLEADAEAEQAQQAIERLSPKDAERLGHALVALDLREEHAGLGGRLLVTLGKRNREPLPWTRLGVGSPVLLSEEPLKVGSGWRGVISHRDGATVQVALARSPETESERPTFRIDLSSDEVARQRQRAALERARTAAGDRLAELRNVLLGEREAAFAAVPGFAPLNIGLDDSQREAVGFCLSAADVAIIHGPPGTGKTTTVVELIRQAVARGEKVLACAPSNLAVDNIFERLLAAGENVVRLGHPARVSPELRAHTLDLIVEAHEDIRVARKLAREAYGLRDRAARFTRAKPPPGAKREMRKEADALLADARRLEAQVVASILDSATVLCATTTGLDSEVLGQREFDLCVIDEACQSTEPGCWIPLMRSQRVVLAGDHQQLPPTVVSADAAKAGFGESLLERLMNRVGTHLSRRLDVQYRMHQDIMDFSSAEFYDGTLLPDDSVAGHLLRDLPDCADEPLTQSPLEFVDTAGAGYDEQLEPEGASRFNPQEAELAAKRVAALLEAGLAPRQIAVIAPYSAQVRLLRELLARPGLEIDSIDGFQGREKEAVVISLVRSNNRGEIGFLGDVRRMNVALTRARRKLIVIGDSATIAGHPFYSRLLEYFEGHAAYRTVWEEM